MPIWPCGTRPTPTKRPPSCFLQATQVYFSVNIRPGNDQLRKFSQIAERFRKHPNFQPKIDDLVQETKDETDIDLKKDVLPWLGPEIAIGLIDVVGSVVAAENGGPPILVVLIGTREPDRASAILLTSIRRQEKEEEIKFETRTYRDLTIYAHPEDKEHYAVTRDYLVLTFDPDLMEDTIDRILDSKTGDSLYASARFQEVRRSLPENRFSTLYVDSETIWLDARRQFGEDIPADIRRQLDDFAPKWLASTGSFFDRGVKFITSIPNKEASSQSSVVPSLAAAKLLPSDTLAFFSFAADPDLEPLRERLRCQGLGTLGPVSEEIALELGLDTSKDLTLSDVLDALLARLKESFDLDLEGDVLSWMTGDLSLVLLPTDFGAFSDDSAGKVQAMALVQHEGSKGGSVASFMDKTVKLLEDNLETRTERVSYGRGEGAIFNLQEQGGTDPYQPGYLILSNHLLVATTSDALKVSASIEEGEVKSLSAVPEYSRLLKELPDRRNPLLYLNLRGIRDAVLQTLDSDEREKYSEDVEPFVGPWTAFLAAVGSQGNISQVQIILAVD